MFCKFCGKQVRDDGYFCPACGGKLKEFSQEETFSTQPPAPLRSSVKVKLCRIFTRLGIIFNAIGFGCLVLQLLAWVLLFACTTQSEYNIVVERLIMCSVICGYLGFVFGFIFVCLGGDLSITGFVFGLLQKEDARLKRKAIGTFIGGMIIVTLFILSFVFSIVYLGVAGTSV